MAAEHTLEKDHALDTLKQTATRLARTEKDLDWAVARAREAGASWGAIGAAMGMTRQAAWERWSG